MQYWDCAGSHVPIHLRVRYAFNMSACVSLGGVQREASSPKTPSLQGLQTGVCFRSGLISPVPASQSAAQVQKELDEYGDIVFVKEKTNYKSILVKTYFVLEYAVLHYDVRYILKTDDDAYINVGALLHQLRLLCQTPDCRNERLYMGKMAKARLVLCV